VSYERRKIRVGKVVSDRMDKSVVVAVEWRQPHRLYRKSVKKLTKFKVHDAENYCKMGDLVRIIETRPLSKTKRWQVVEVLSREEIAEIQPEEITVDEDVLVAIPEHPDDAAAPASVEDVEEGSAAVSDVPQAQLGEAEAEAEAPMAVNDEEEASAAVSDVPQEQLVNDTEEAPAADAGDSPAPAADDVPGSPDSESDADEGRVSGV
jgi:small subunit ribosomal protein S17